jgi:WbqC-like protein family
MADNARESSETEVSLPEPVLVVLQPGYLPWLGFFDQFRRSDIFVYYDDVQYDKHGWRNRNRIKTQTGPLWLTVPVRHTGLGLPRILDIEIDSRSPWQRKHISSIMQAYAHAPYVDTYLPTLEELLHRKWERLVDLDIAVAQLICGWLGLSRRVERSSTLSVGGDRSERLVRLCEHFGARTYLSGNAASDYLDVDLFAHHGVQVQWQNFDHPVYPQLHGEFVPFMSAIDLILNCGETAPAVLAGAGAL